MRRGGVIFFQILIALFGVGVLALMLWEPHLEGRNIGATLFEVYFRDPFLAYVYVGSLPFFVALYQTFAVLGHVGRGEASSPAAVRALRIIRYCAIALTVFIAGAEVFILLGESDDAAGGVAMGVLAMVGVAIIATVATVLERTLRRISVMQSSNA